MKAYTDLEQSKKLAEILPIESADMWWAERYEGRVLENGQYVVNDTPYYYLSIVQPSSNNWSQDTVKDVPCWSLAALLEIYPMVVGRDMGMYCCWCNKHHLTLRHHNNPIDACVEMIIKLKEKKLI